MRTISEPTTSGSSLGRVNLATLAPAVPDASLEIGKPSVLVTSAHSYAYAVHGRLPEGSTTGDGALRVRVHMRVARGGIGVGVTNTRGDWISFTVVPEDDVHADRSVDLLIPAVSRREIGELILSNGVADGLPSRATIESIDVDELSGPAIKPLPASTCPPKR